MNICVDCKHHRIINLSKMSIINWFHHRCFCPAAESQGMIDPVTGHTEYQNETAQPYCRDINTDGECELFELKHVNSKEHTP